MAQTAEYPGGDCKLFTATWDSNNGSMHLRPPSAKALSTLPFRKPIGKAVSDISLGRSDTPQALQYLLSGETRLALG
jgi:hypothetical protein